MLEDCGMPRYTTSQTYTDGNTQIVALSQGEGQLVPYAPQSSAIAEVLKDDEDLEVKLRRISEQVPVRISNTSGSSAGSGSGDFHQYRQMRRREQDRLARMDADYERRKEEAEFEVRRESRLKAAEERTAKKRAKRQKKKERKKQKKAKPENNLLLIGNKEGGNETENSDSDDDNDDQPPSSQGRDCSHVG